MVVESAKADEEQITFHSPLHSGADQSCDIEELFLQRIVGFVIRRCRNSIENALHTFRALDCCEESLRIRVCKHIAVRKRGEIIDDQPPRLIKIQLLMVLIYSHLSCDISLWPTFKTRHRENCRVERVCSARQRISQTSTRTLGDTSRILALEGVDCIGLLDVRKEADTTLTDPIKKGFFAGWLHQTSNVGNESTFSQII
mmetsp:Transcript_37222/g.99092  ORF Transcript_37222/g.99092 Transcript_37222/m.99092 type:complete len:200 (-) Transcript_37222:3901-4500(-)